MHHLLITSTEFARDHWDEIERVCLERNCHPIVNVSRVPMNAVDICQLNDEITLDGILVYSSSDEISRSVFENCSKLKVISRHGVGAENIDLGAAEEFGVCVKTTQDCPYHESVADFTFGLILALCRGICEAERNLRNGLWQRSKSVDLWGKTLGIIGLGRIGKSVVRRAKGFDLRILGFDPYVDPKYIEQEKISLCALDDLLRGSDVVTIHCPLQDDTRGLIKGRELNLMKPGAFLINTARSGLIDQVALIEALQKAVIAGAAVDVYEREPAQSDPLVTAKLDNLIATPHIASFTSETLREMDRLAIRNVLEVFEKRT